MRAWALLSFVGLFATSVARAQPPAQVLSVGERKPVAFVLGTPTGEPGQTSRSQIIRIVSDLLRRQTNLELVQLGAEVMNQCRGRLACLSDQAREDYRRSALLDDAGRPLRFETHLRRLRNGKVPYTKYLLLVSNVTIREQPDQISVVLIDTDIALGIAHDASRSAEDWQDAVEARISATALVMGPVKGELRGPDDAQVFWGRLFETNLQPVLAKHGHWSPYGRIDLNCAHNDAIIFLDEQALGATQAGTTRIDKVNPGSHTIRVELAGHQSWTTDVQVRRGQTQAQQVHLPAILSESASYARDTTLWTGAALVALGAGLTIYGVQKANSGVQTACFDVPGAPCSSGTRFITFGYNPDAIRTDSGPVNPGGLMIVPLGYSLAGTGATLTAGSLLSDEADLPWATWAAGLAVGVVAYGLSAIVAGPLE